jgi:hypothetical protein
MGDELCKYINQIATANAQWNEDTAANDSSLAVDEKKLTKALAQLTKLVTNKENKPPSNNNVGGCCADKQFTGICNMGAYCHSHGYHPVEKNHDSNTCKYKKEEHNAKATWNNRLGGNKHWPTTTCVAIAQQNHTMYKGKSKPTA